MAVLESVITFSDILDYAVHYLEGGARSKDKNMMRESVIGAYRDITLARQWQYYLKEHRIDIVASYDTGTVTFDLTGHVEGERALTIATGTWPSWIKQGRILLDGVVYKVSDTTTDSDVVLLDESMAPLADVAASTYVAYRSAYPFPDDMWEIGDVMVEDSNWSSHYIPPTTWMQRERFYESSGSPWAFTIMKDEDKDGRWSLIVDPYPSGTDRMMFVYRRSPRVLRWSGVESATRETAGAAISVSDTTVTTTATLPQNMVGSIMRFHTDTSAYPTGFAGQNPYHEQQVIKSISGTTVTLQEAMSSAFAISTKIQISDPIDMPDQMIEALKAQVEYRLTRSSREGRGRGVQQAFQIAQSAIRTALEQEARHGGGSSYFPRYQYLFTHLAGQISDF